MAEKTIPPPHTPHPSPSRLPPQVLNQTVRPSIRPSNFSSNHRPRTPRPAESNPANQVGHAHAKNVSHGTPRIATHGTVSHDLPVTLSLRYLIKDGIQRTGIASGIGFDIFTFQTKKNRKVMNEVTQRRSLHLLYCLCAEAKCTYFLLFVVCFQS